MGLSISPQYVRLMGGELTMLSALREGSKFCFGLRVAPTDAAIPYVAETVRPRVVGLAPRPPSYRLLALDDKPENRRLLVQLLARALRPAGDASGDFYDASPLPGARLGILMADVVDKGVGAALYMALCWTLIRTYAPEYPWQPECVLETANRRILFDTRADQFVTAFFGVLDPSTGSLVYCSAGHCPPDLVHRLDVGVVQQLARTGVPLGIYDDNRWERRSVQLDPGDVLVLYTDGVTEACDGRDSLFGEERLLACVRANVGRSAQWMLDAILAEVARFVGAAPQSDDIALAVVAREGQHTIAVSRLISAMDVPLAKERRWL